MRHGTVMCSWRIVTAVANQRSVPHTQTRGQETTLAPLASTAENDSWYTLTLPPEERVSLRLPREFTTGSHAVRWSSDAIIGGVGKLNLFEGSSVSAVFHTAEPKVLCFYDKTVTTMSEVERTFSRAVQPFINDIIAMTAGEARVKEGMQTSPIGFLFWPLPG
jgi:hypothetical protein